MDFGLYTTGAPFSSSTLKIRPRIFVPNNFPASVMIISGSPVSVAYQWLTVYLLYYHASLYRVKELRDQNSTFQHAHVPIVQNNNIVVTNR